MAPETTGVDFTNTLPESATFNILNYLYYYNGGGVAVGDVDGDGLVDIYFTSNLGRNRLFRNKGNFQFEDVTDSAGVAGPPGWNSGVTMADVDGDGHLDIYVSTVSSPGLPSGNVLYVNDGLGAFTDRTAEFGLEQAVYATQALFLDYDNDGDLDAYLLNSATHAERSLGEGDADEKRRIAEDRLLRNDSGRFVDVSGQAGLVRGLDGFGLGVVASDLNDDGCIDIYVANDFQENDLLYMNDCDGTFTESVTRMMGHTSRFSMGVDAADFNNDGRPDIFVGDMLPEREDVLKTSASSETFNLFQLRLRAGYHPQYARNTLQLNRGGGRFSEIGYLAGVHATDWTWAPLFADLDNDGRKDLFVTNGILRRPNDLDYINYVGNEVLQAGLARGDPDASAAVMRRMPQVPLSNYAFRNNGNLTFTNVAAEWGLAQAGFSNGAAYADLDNDGALDLIVNNVNGPAWIYRNRAREQDGSSWLTVALRGSGRNTGGIGAKVVAWHGETAQFLEQAPTRGFQSSVDHRLHFGLGKAVQLDSLTVIWPDRSYQVMRDVRANQMITLSQADASGRRDYAAPSAPRPLFSDVTSSARISWVHAENPFLDTDREPLMPHLLSAEGPALAVADVNGDRLDDFFVGGAKWQPSRLFIQQPDGSFTTPRGNAFAADSVDEDVDAEFFDADGDGDMDLYVVTAGNEFSGNADQLLDRLYLNDGSGGFTEATDDALPRITENGGCVAAGDYDGDGDLDLFVGTRVVSRSYGVVPRSYLLRNNGRGRFEDVTETVMPLAGRVGMVSSCTWITRNRRPHLVVAGEWMPVSVYSYDGKRLVDRTESAGLAGTEGWWSSVTAVDLNGDGLQDLVLGNVGLNSYVKASAAEPARMHVYDFGKTGAQKQVIEFFRHGSSYPLAGRDELLGLIPSLRGRYPSYESFGASRVTDIFPAAELSQATVHRAHVFATSVAIARANGRFEVRALPMDAQFAPVYAVVSGDFDRDGAQDLLLGGNNFGVPPVIGRYDASHGLVLRGNADGSYASVDMHESGVAIEGQIRAMQWLRQAHGRRVIIVARNGEALQFLRLRPILSDRAKQRLAGEG